jgi:hypothetical protein
MASVVVSPSNVVTYPEGGGHFWVFMQYVLGLRESGCDVYWLEHHARQGDRRLHEAQASVLLHRMERFGLADRTILYSASADDTAGEGAFDYRGWSRDSAEALFARVDLLLNFHYTIHPRMLARFRRSALVDIDPGLLQFWIATGQLRISDHDLYFTTGDTVGTPGAAFPDTGLPWRRIRPVVSLPHWPVAFEPSAEAFTTVSGWWGGDGKGEWITDGADIFFENNKRVSFLEFVELPRHTEQVLELALCLGEGDPEPADAGETRGSSRDPGRQWLPAGVQEADTTDYISDAVDRRRLEQNGWRLRHAHDVAGTPDAYQAYIQGSRGEFSCVKPSCIEFRNGWVSDRTLCFVRFSSLEEAVEGLERINADYRTHCRAARAIAAEYFDATSVLEDVLNAV